MPAWYFIDEGSESRDKNFRFQDDSWTYIGQFLPSGKFLLFIDLNDLKVYT